MTPFVGLLFGRATLADPDDLSIGQGLVGRPVWGRTALLANLELRLGLSDAEGSKAIRTQRWSRHLDELACESPRFYSRSYAVDPIGTSKAVLSLRDALIDAGWDGELIADGGERLDTLHILESQSGAPPGRPDRLRRVEEALRGGRVRPFDGIALAEPRDVWSGRWQRVFSLLEARGVPVRSREPEFAPLHADTDLGRLQALLRDNTVGSPHQLEGDGSLVLLRAETSWESGHAVAALLREWEDPSTAVIRTAEARPLDLALKSNGFPSQGVSSSSPWRPILQVLPLAVELAFEPRDPYRVLELLTLPIGPFSGLMGNRLAHALAEAPGVGGRGWQFAKESVEKELLEHARRSAAKAGNDEENAIQAARADVAERLLRLAEWVEAPAHDAVKGAPRSALLLVADRVRSWLRRQLVVTRLESGREAGDGGAGRQVGVVAAALAQAQAFHDALSHEPRDSFDLVGARQLVEDLSSAGEPFLLEVEQSGRFDLVDTPAGLLRARDTVVWWHCVAGTEWRPITQPWRRSEVAAIRAAGILLPEPAKRLAVEARAFRSAILAARKRLVLVAPRWAGGLLLEPHPVWDEIVARFRARPVDIARVTLDVQGLREGKPSGGIASALSRTIHEVPPLALPDARPSWKLDGSLLAGATKHSASSVEALIGCPLQWVLRYRAGLRAESIAGIPSDPQLNGKLGHRLVEELHLTDALSCPERTAAAAPERFDRLVLEEAAVLLRPGKAFELAQLKGQLTRSVTALAELLASSKLTVAAVESTNVVPWGERSLEGRLDLILQAPDGANVVLDLKWGASRYRGLLQDGRAVQLAIYAAVLQLAKDAGELPGAAYFSLSRGELLATDVGRFGQARAINGPDLATTWKRIEQTVGAVEQALARGDVAATGVTRSVPLLKELKVPEAEHPRHFEPGAGDACEHCKHSALCGRAWEGFR